MYEFVDEHFNGFANTKTVAATGDAAEEILNYIEAQGIEFVIMGTHGRKGMDKIIFGSVAEWVLSHVYRKLLALLQFLTDFRYY